MSPTQQALLQNVSAHLFDELGFSRESLLESFLLQRYADGMPPQEILVPIELESAEAGKHAQTNSATTDNV